MEDGTAEEVGVVFSLLLLLVAGIGSGPEPSGSGGAETVASEGA